MNRKIGILIGICLILGVQDVTAAGPLRRYVLVVGSNNGGTDRVSLRYAVSDAEHFAEVLEIMGGVDSADRILLVDPDLQAFYQALDEIRKKVQSVPSGTGRTEVIFYYSGHADATKGNRTDFGLHPNLPLRPRRWIRRSNLHIGYLKIT